MLSANNIIRRETINFHINGNVDGLALQQEIADWCRNGLNPSLDSFLWEYEHVEEVIRIDSIRLDIDVNFGNADSWKEGLAEKILYQFQEKIRSEIGSRSEGIIQSLSQKFYQTLIYFLKHGILPWNTSIKNRHEFEEEVSGWIRTAQDSELKSLVAELQHEIAAKRLAHLLSQQDFETLVAGSIEQTTASILTISEDVKTIVGIIAERQAVELLMIIRFRELVMQEIMAQKFEDAPNRAMEQWLYHLQKESPESFETLTPEVVKSAVLQNLIRSVQKAPYSAPEQSHSPNTAAQIAQTPDSAKLADTNNKGDDEARTAASENVEENQEQIAWQSITTEKDTTAAKVRIEKDEVLQTELRAGVFIPNAGAVIIAPFLSTLFSRAGLLEEYKISDNEAAVCLLHYCITGNTSPAEFELLFPKILCGIPPETLISGVAMVEESVLKEADEMLESVIEYWKILRDTSIQTLRESFLQRNGKLSSVNGEWLLQVEQQSYDMLLEQLPWNISLIKLPWMDTLIRTEWV